MTIPENVRDVVDRIITTLPPAFVLLLLINLVFILGLLWFMHDLQITRIEALTRIFQACTAALAR